MITQTYILQNLPKAIINDDNCRGLKFTRGIEKDINAELGMFLNTRWSMEPTYGKDLILHVDVHVEHAEILNCLMHNLHSAKLTSTKSI